MANDSNWRLPLWIVFGLDLFFLLWFIFLYEESKYLPAEDSIPGEDAVVETRTTKDGGDKDKAPKASSEDVDVEIQSPRSSTRLDDTTIDDSIPTKTWRQKLRLLTTTDENLWETAFRPFPILVNFPVVMYTALQYSFCLAWISVLGATIAIVYPYAPYGFSPSGIGLMSLGTFIGCILGSIYGGLLSDVSVVYLAKRNRGYYEPEMRLHILHLPVICQAAGILTFGLTTAKVSPSLLQQESWPYINNSFTGNALDLPINRLCNIWIWAWIYQRRQLDAHYRLLSGGQS